MNVTLPRWPCWTSSTCVCIGLCLNSKLLFVFDAIWDCNLTLLCYPNTLKWRWRLHETVSCWPWTNRTYVRIGVCSYVKLLLVFGTVIWGRNLTRMCCPNTPQRWWRLCVNYVRWMNGTVSYRPRIISMYVCSYWCVFEFETVICVRCSMRS